MERSSTMKPPGHSLALASATISLATAYTSVVADVQPRTRRCAVIAAR